MLMREAAAEYKWNLNYAGIALMWRGGTLITSLFGPIVRAVVDLLPYIHRMYHQECLPR